MSGGMYCRAFPSFSKFFLVLTFFHPDLSVRNCASFTVSAGGQTPGVLGIFFFKIELLSLKRSSPVNK